MGYFSNLSVEILGDKTQVAILRFLYRNKPNRFSQKQISDSVGIHPSSISRACGLLEKFNLIDKQNAGKTNLYKIAGNSYIVQKILKPLFDNEANFFSDLIKNIVQSLTLNLKSKIKNIFLFGSIIKGMDTPASDIDLAIELQVNTKKSEIDEIREHFINKAVYFRLGIDMHFFIKGEKAQKKGLSLERVKNSGELVWENNNEKLSKR